MVRYPIAGIALLLLQAVPQPSAPQTPVFRAGAHYVRVDAYPTQDGRIVEGLTKDDFEIFEDDKPQTVAAAELVTFAEPDDARGSMLSAREGLELASDPHYRVVIFVIDRAVFDLPRWQAMREDLRDFLGSQAGPRDLVGLITTDRPWTDLVLGRRIQSIVDEIDTPEWLHARPQEQTAVLDECGLDGLQGRIRADETYGLLENIIKLLAQVRDDRTSLVFVSAGLARVPPDRRWQEQRPLALPAFGLEHGRIRRIPRASAMHDRMCGAEGHRLADTDFDRRFGDLVAAARAANVSFYPVAMPALAPLMTGSPTPGFAMSGRGFGAPPAQMANRVPTTLLELARGTNGYLVTGADVRDGLHRLVSDSGPHYLLGYYTTNGKRDGKVRSIRVQLKKYGNVIQSRRFYRAPGKEDLETAATPRPTGSIGPPPPVTAALDALSRLRSSTQFFAYGAVAGNALTVVIEVPPAAVQAGRWKDGAALEVLAETGGGQVVGTARARLLPNGRAVLRVPLDGGAPPAEVFVRLRADGESVVERTGLAAGPSTLVGDPQAYRSGPRGLAIPVARFELARDEQLKLDWPVMIPLERVGIRLLDRNGQPLRHRLAVEEQDGAGGRHLVSNLSFTALGRGDYVVELSATAGAVAERKLLAFRVK